MTQNADPAEIAHFATLSKHWWDTSGELATLHAINPTRLTYIQQQAPLQGKTVLDVGCGGGILAEGMCQLGANVTGIDLCEPALIAARAHQAADDKKVNYLHISTEELSKTHAAHFDTLTCLELLEHTPDPASIILASSELVKSGGNLFFSTLNRTLRAWLFAIAGAEYVLKLLPKNTHDYTRFIRPATLSAWLRTAGLEPVNITGLRYHPFSKKCILTKDVSINYIIHARKP